MDHYLLVLDTPGIKQFVFGADGLAAIRGGSALLDRLNRLETRGRLAAGPVHDVEQVFSNGGTGQFLITAVDEAKVRAAAEGLCRYYREQTGGEMRPLFAVAKLAPNGNGYRDAVAAAFAELQLQRNLGGGRPTAPTLPFVEECKSSSHLPAVGPFKWGNERLVLSDASQRKYRESQKAAHGVLWTGWIEHLKLGGFDLEKADELRYVDASSIGRHSRRREQVGLVYADGNAMGRLVQDLDSAHVTGAFSAIVDDAVRGACYDALSAVFAAEVASLRAAHEAHAPLPKLPADILLLGGDDLLVLVPGDRALTFAARVTEAFERRTGTARSSSAPAVQQFFDERLGKRDLTISCGVAVGSATFPFYLLLDLAESLLASAKRAGNDDPDREAKGYWAPCYVDFHVISGSGGVELPAIRAEEYRTATEARRTLRPYRRDRLDCLLDAARRLDVARLPRSKLHDLFEAALTPRPALAQRLAEDLFGRLKDVRQRSALWESLAFLGALDPYPWTALPGGKATALADLVEVLDLIP